MPRRQNAQLFALPQAPPDELLIAGGRYHLLRVFKHDFYAATSLYEKKATGSRQQATGAEPAPPSLLQIENRQSKIENQPPPKVVVKLYRRQNFCGLPLEWLGRACRDRERAAYQLLAGLEGIPRYVGDVGRAGCAIEYIDSRPLDHGVDLPGDFWDRLAALMAGVHARGLAYVDANKRSNILVGNSGRPYLIDFQISLRRRDDWPWPLRSIPAAAVRAMQAKDIYHLYKHKRRMAPGLLTADEEKLSRRAGFFHGLHARLTKPYRAIRRGFLSRQFRQGKLVSPSADLETHYQPEKESWRK